MTDRPKRRKGPRSRRPVRRAELPFENADVTSPEQWVTEQEASFNAARNPIYVWQALDLLNFRRFNSAIESGDWNPGDPLPPLVLPEWCTRYLTYVALQIEYVGRGLDVRRQPKLTGDRCIDDRAREDWYANPTLNAKSALSRLPASLLFTRAGWNALDEFWRTERKRLAADTGDLLRSDGLSSREVYERILTDFKIEDERTFRRYTAEARRHRPSKPKLP